MSNGAYCCAIGVCCPPDSAERRSALVAELSHGMAEKGHDAAGDTLEHVVDWLIANVDMLPKGSLDLGKVTDLLKKG